MNDRPHDDALLALLYDELPPAEAEALREKLAAEDPQSLERLAEWQAIRDVVADLPELEPDPQVHYDIIREARRAVDSEAEPVGIWGWLQSLMLTPAFAGLLLVVLAAGLTVRLTTDLEQADDSALAPPVVEPAASPIAEKKATDKKAAAPRTNADAPADEAPATEDPTAPEATDPMGPKGGSPFGGEPGAEAEPEGGARKDRQPNDAPTTPMVEGVKGEDGRAGVLDGLEVPALALGEDAFADLDAPAEAEEQTPAPKKTATRAPRPTERKAKAKTRAREKALPRKKAPKRASRRENGNRDRKGGEADLLNLMGDAAEKAPAAEPAPVAKPAPEPRPKADRALEDAAAPRTATNPPADTLDDDDVAPMKAALDSRRAADAPSPQAASPAEPLAEPQVAQGYAPPPPAVEDAEEMAETEEVARAEARRGPALGAAAADEAVPDDVVVQTTAGGAGGDAADQPAPGGAAARDTEADRLSRARLLRARGLHREAISEFEAFLADVDGQSGLDRVWFETAESYRALGQIDRAERLYRLVAGGDSSYAPRARARIAEITGASAVPAKDTPQAAPARARPNAAPEEFDAVEAVESRD